MEGKHMKKKILKGFTLIELIVVMAIFSLLMAGALALVDPVSKIHKNASDFEKTYAYVDNIQDYLQDSLKYAENVWIYQGNYDDTFLAAEAENFRNNYYSNTVYTSDGTHTVYTKGNIRIMTILNNDVLDGGGGIKTDSSGARMCKGQILLNNVNYDADSSISSIGDAQTQLNPDFFSKDFSFQYLFGASQLVNSGSNNTALVENLSSGASMDYQNFAVGIVTYDNKEYAKLSSPAPGEYPFTCQYSVASIPLMNIIRNNGIPKTYYVYGEKDDGFGNMIPDTSKIVSQTVPSGASFTNYVSSPSNPNDNIYIIYSLSDEVNIPQ